MRPRFAVVLACLICGGCGASPADSGGPAPGAAPEPRPPGEVAIVLQPTPPPGLHGTLAFHSDRAGRHRLFTIDLATTMVSGLTSGTDYHDEEAAWSADGAQVAFTTTRFDFRTWDIAVMDATGGSVRRVITHLATDRHAAWAPDGRSVLFSSEQEGTQAVFRAWIETGQVTRVSPPPDRALMPAVAPDGRRVAYTMGTPGGLRLAVQDLESGEVRLVTPEGFNVAGARWSPDGTRLAYARLSPGGSAIEILTLATGTVQPMPVEGVAELREPTWSPDGQWIAAAGSTASGDSADWNLLVLRPSPPAAFRLTSGAGNDRAPAWMPR